MRHPQTYDRHPTTVASTNLSWFSMKYRQLPKRSLIGYGGGQFIYNLYAGFAQTYGAVRP